MFCEKVFKELLKSGPDEPLDLYFLIINEKLLQHEKLEKLLELIHTNKHLEEQKAIEEAILGDAELRMLELKKYPSVEFVESRLITQDTVEHQINENHDIKRREELCHELESEEQEMLKALVEFEKRFLQ